MIRSLLRLGICHLLKP